jgi:hypothetical protein
LRLAAERLAAERRSPEWGMGLDVVLVTLVCAAAERLASERRSPEWGVRLDVFLLSLALWVLGLV